MIEQALARGVSSQGAQLVSTGIVPTPAVAYLTRSMDFDAGIVISASHNPFRDNGIKVFSGRGEKFDEASERAIEALVADPAFVVPPAAGEARVERRISSAPTSRTRAKRSATPRRCAARASRSTAPTARRRRRRRGCFASSGSTSP